MTHTKIWKKKNTRRFGQTKKFAEISSRIAKSFGGIEGRSLEAELTRLGRKRDALWWRRVPYGALWKRKLYGNHRMSPLEPFCYCYRPYFVLA